MHGALRSVLRSLADLYMFLFLMKPASRRLRSLASSCEDPECIVRLAFEFEYGPRPLPPLSIRPFQVFEEILELAKMVRELRPRAVLEIGTAKGGTLFIWCMVSPEDATIISVDLPGGLFGGGYTRWRIPLYKSFAKPKQRLHLIKADSHDPRTLEKVKRALGGRPLDFLFIDGDHSYEGVKMDFEMYSPLVREGGLIALHDIVEHPPETGCEVSKFWREIKQRYRHTEIVKDWGQKWAGIGVVFI